MDIAGKLHSHPLFATFSPDALSQAARAGVKVNPETGKTASIHDLRRSFGSRWAKKVMPAVLQRLMRHADIGTTMRYYVDLDADELAEDLWAGHSPENGNTVATLSQDEAENDAPPAATPPTESPCTKTTYTSEGQGTLTLNRQAGT